MGLHHLKLSPDMIANIRYHLLYEISLRPDYRNLNCVEYFICVGDGRNAEFEFIMREIWCAKCDNFGFEALNFKNQSELNCEQISSKV